MTRLPFDLPDNCISIRQKCARWADDNIEALKFQRPAIPNVGNDRAMDNWLPLLSIADIASGEWPELARQAMKGLENQIDLDEGVGPMILNDIKEVFDKKNVSKMFSDQLVEYLIDLEERPWCEWKHGKPITKNSLARLLNPFGIRSGSIRLGETLRKGYKKESFKDSFSRYLSNTPIQNGTPAQVNETGGCSDLQNGTSNSSVPFQKPLKPNRNEGCAGVSFQKGGIEPERELNPKFTPNDAEVF